MLERLYWVWEEGSADCWYLFIQHSHLMPTMKLLPHYLWACQDADAPSISHSSYSQIARWQTGTCLCIDVNSHARTRTHKQTARMLWSWLGDSWCLVFPPVQNAERSQTLSPPKQTNNKKRSRWAARGRFWILKTGGHLPLVLWPSSLSAAGGQGGGGLYGWQLSTQVMWFSNHLFAE